MAKLFGNRYQSLERIGHGGMASVYLAFDVKLQRKVALKVMHEHMQNKANLRNRFRQEARSVSNLKHPNILEIYDYSGDDVGELWLVTEYIKGFDLNHYSTLFPHGQIHPLISTCIIREIAKALSEAHRRGIIHRDIKASNIMTTYGGQIKLMDFGIAKNLVVDMELTQTGSFIGSPCYMSPEQLKGEKIDPRTDIYSLAALFYKLLTGVLPYDGDSAPAIMEQVISQPIPQCKKIKRTIPSYLSYFVAKGMAKNPDDRHQSVNIIVEKLDKFLRLHQLRDSSLELELFFSNPKEFASRVKTNIKAIKSIDPDISFDTKDLIDKYKKSRISQKSAKNKKVVKINNKNKQKIARLTRINDNADKNTLNVNHKDKSSDEVNKKTVLSSKKDQANKLKQIKKADKLVKKSIDKSQGKKQNLNNLEKTKKDKSHDDKKNQAQKTKKQLAQKELKKQSNLSKNKDSKNKDSKNKKNLKNSKIIKNTKDNNQFKTIVNKNLNKYPQILNTEHSLKIRSEVIKSHQNKLEKKPKKKQEKFLLNKKVKSKSKSLDQQKNQIKLSYITPSYKYSYPNKKTTKKPNNYGFYAVAAAVFLAVSLGIYVLDYKSFELGNTLFAFKSASDKTASVQEAYVPFDDDNERNASINNAISATTLPSTEKAQKSARSSQDLKEKNSQLLSKPTVNPPHIATETVNPKKHKLQVKSSILKPKTFSPSALSSTLHKPYTQRLPSGALRAYITPPADVYINNVLIGNSAKVFKKPLYYKPGLYKLTIQKPNYKTYERTILIKDRQVLKLKKISLEKIIYYSLQVQGPKGTNFLVKSLNGDYSKNLVLRTSQYNLRLQKGQYQIIATKAGVTFKRNVRLPNYYGNMVVSLTF